MSNKINQGDYRYIFDNRYGYCKVKILKCSGNFYTIKLLEHDCGYRVPSNRLLTEDEYSEILSEMEHERNNRSYLATFLNH